MLSESPFSETYEYERDDSAARHQVERFVEQNRREGHSIIAVQGLGFVGTAMVAALSEARNESGNPIYGVIGVDLPDESNYWKIARTNEGKPARVDSDPQLQTAYRRGIDRQNLLGTYSLAAYELADVVVVDIPLDAEKPEPGDVDNYSFSYDTFEEALQTVARRIPAETLVVVETTVPPGTTEQVVLPIFEDAFAERGIEGIPRLAHSYERVMPGGDYLESITDYYRVYAGIDNESTEMTCEFLQSFINTEEYPLTRLESPTASEMAKVLENSYRAMNIAFIHEWTEFAEQAGVDLFSVVRAIQKRETHKNIRWPGFGVGGYCLPKDPLLADWSYSELFGGEGELRMSKQAVEINDFMPLYTWKLLSQHTDLDDRKMSILGIAYLGNTADTRSSPTSLFYDRCIEEGLDVYLHDPFVGYWPERDVEVDRSETGLESTVHDIVVLATRHDDYLDMGVEDFERFFGDASLVVDANDMLSDEDAAYFADNETKVLGVGKGHWNQLNEA